MQRISKTGNQYSEILDKIAQSPSRVNDTDLNAEWPPTEEWKKQSPVEKPVLGPKYFNTINEVFVPYFGEKNMHILVNLTDKLYNLRRVMEEIDSRKSYQGVPGPIQHRFEDFHKRLQQACSILQKLIGDYIE